MLILRNLMSVSIALSVTLFSGVSLTAQTPPTPTDSTPPPSETSPPPETTPPTNSTPNVNDLKPTTEGDTVPSQSIPQYIKPSANPLLFPTQPREVDITKVRPITLEQAVELAIKNNPDLQETRLSLERSRAELTEANAALYPSLNSQFDFTREQSIPAQQQNERRVNAGLPPDINENQTTSLNRLELSYDVYTGGERAARITRAEQEVRRRQLEVERISEQTRFDATDRYYELQRADAQVAIGQAAVEDASISLRDARLLEQAGLGTKFSVLQAEVDLARANQQLTQSIADQRVARRRLASVLNIGQQVELTAAEPIQEAGIWPLTLDETIVQAYKNRAELEQRLIERDQFEQDASIALATIKPQVQVFANYRFEDDFDDDVGVADGYLFGTRLTWNFFDGGRAFARERQANRNRDIATTQFTQQRNAIRLQVEDAYYNLIANQENIKTAAINVTTATESLRLARLRFQAGVGTQTDVINSQRDLTQARSDYLQAIIDYNQSLNALSRAVSNLPDNLLFKQP